MNKSLTLAAIAVCVLLVVPVGVANWSSYGQSEPNSVYDIASFMYPAPPALGEAKVYFNAYTTMGPGVIKGVSPNVGLVGTQIEAMGVEQSYAVLGVWTDCNGDGYIGLAEGALLEYPSQVPNACTPRTGGSTCFQVVTPPNKCPNWPATGYNNYNGMVTELIPILGGAARPSGEARVIRDSQAAVWADNGRPQDGATGGSCAIRPLPRGSAQSSGGLITYFDCRSGAIEAWNAGVDAAGDPASLRFSDDADGRSGALGQFETLGDRYDDPNRDSSPIVKAQDCDSAVLVPWAGTPVAGQTQSEGIRSPSTAIQDGSIAGTVNYTFESFPFPTRQTAAQTGPASTSNCDGTDDRGDDVYSLVEGDFNSVSTLNKHEADWNFVPVAMTRGGVPLGLGHSGAAGDPNDMGITAFDAVCPVCGRSEWSGGVNFVKGAPQNAENRGGLAAEDLPNPALEGAYWLTHYARVGSTTITAASIPGSNTGQPYGAAQCGSNTGGIHNGWNCDVTTWNKNPDGSALPANGGVLAFPGLMYHLRDVDCYDGSLGVGVGVQPAFFSDAGCITG